MYSGSPFLNDPIDHQPAADKNAYYWDATTRLKGGRSDALIDVSRRWFRWLVGWLEGSQYNGYGEFCVGVVLTFISQQIAPLYLLSHWA